MRSHTKWLPPYRERCYGRVCPYTNTWFVRRLPLSGAIGSSPNTRHILLAKASINPGTEVENGCNRCAFCRVSYAASTPSVYPPTLEHVCLDPRYCRGSFNFPIRFGASHLPQLGTAVLCRVVLCCAVVGLVRQCDVLISCALVGLVPRCCTVICLVGLRHSVLCPGRLGTPLLCRLLLYRALRVLVVFLWYDNELHRG